MKQLDPKAVWLFFLPSLILVAVITIPMCCVFAGLAFAPNSGGVLVGALITLLIMAGLLAFSYFWAVLMYNNFKYDLSEDAFKKEQGVIFKKYTSVPYERIQNVDIHRSLLSRILGLSDIHIQTAGFSGMSPYGMANPEGRLPALSKEVAEEMRDELIKRAKAHKK